MPHDSESPKPTNGDGQPPASPGRRPSISLQAAATLNAGLQRESPSRGMDPPTNSSMFRLFADSNSGSSNSSPFSPRRESPSAGRRRSQVLMNLQIADPSVPAPGEMVSDSQSSSYQAPSPVPISASPRLIASGGPHHSRTMSLGELHQELENEQESQVNRLLGEIRRLKEQLERQQQGQSAVAGDEASDRAVPFPISTSSPRASYPAGASSGSLPRSPGFPHHPRSSFDMARSDLHRRSRTPSRHASPRLRSTSISGDSGEQWVLGGRDESAFYQAETQMLIRENQMLRHRIRELGELCMVNYLETTHTNIRE